MLKTRDEKQDNCTKLVDTSSLTNSLDGKHGLCPHCRTGCHAERIAAFIHLSNCSVPTAHIEEERGLIFTFACLLSLCHLGLFSPYAITAKKWHSPTGSRTQQVQSSLDVHSHGHVLSRHAEPRRKGKRKKKNVRVRSGFVSRGGVIGPSTAFQANQAPVCCGCPAGTHGCDLVSRVRLDQSANPVVVWSGLVSRVEVIVETWSFRTLVFVFPHSSSARSC